MGIPHIIDRTSDVGNTTDTIAGTFTGYEQPATVTVNVDGDVVVQHTFTGDWSFTVPVDPAVPHAYTVTVVYGQLTSTWSNTMAASGVIPVAVTPSTTIVASTLPVAVAGLTVAEVAVPTVVSYLPETGAKGDVAIGGTVALALGVAAVWAARRRRVV